MPRRRPGRLRGDELLPAPQLAPAPPLPRRGRPLAESLGLPEAVDLVGRYLVTWRPYSTVDGAGRGEFRWTSAVVDAPASLKERRVRAVE